VDIGLISDLHAPYQHPDALDFIKRIKDIYNLNRWICLGDEVDYHAISFHDADQELFSAGHELNEAKGFMKDLSSLIPKLDVLESNHGSLVFRKAKHHGIPVALLKSYNEMLDVSDSWEWHFEMTVKLDNKMQLYLHHGKSADVFKLSQAQGMCAAQGHYHEKFNIHYWGNSLGLYWGMQCGCLIDPKSLAFAYNKNNLKRPIIGTGVIIDDQPLLIPMVLDKKGRWVGRIV
jgi:hypothetical protein